MRVIAGKAKGRRLKSVKGMTTRPTSDRVKESLFAILGSTAMDAVALDIFAGTGNLGIEALSRGTKFCVFVEKDRRAVRVIYDNLTITGFGERALVLPVDVAKGFKVLAEKKYCFDLVFADPPYRLNVVSEILTGLEQFSLMRQRGLVIYEHAAGLEVPESVGRFIRQRQENYGETQLTFYFYTR